MYRYRLEKTYHFDAAHHLRNTKSLVSKKCCNRHGHRWYVKVVIKTNKLIDGMIIDFGKIKKIIDNFDHKDLNDIISFDPTAENLAGFIHDLIGKEYIEQFSSTVILGLKYKIWITVEESPGAKITYSGKT